MYTELTFISDILKINYLLNINNYGKPFKISNCAKN